MTRLLLAGATGLVGGEALALALRDERVTHVVAPTRRPLAPHSKLLNPIVDPGNLPLDADWWTADGGLCAIGTTRAKTPSAAAYRAIDFDYALAIATRIREGGAPRFALTSSMGANAQSRFFYTRIKGELEEAVAQLDFPSLTIIRPGFIGGNRKESRPIEQFMNRFLRIADPLMPAVARISPSSTISALLIDAAIAGTLGNHRINSAAIARSSRTAAVSE
ncbi:NAD-dependent dehydratase [Sphingobium bisphenolivorans]|uniref:NAD-dependent dehydratase n=1 Tax=Sphingobium bisphenolivorans TaxID=1335760 RepID=UPI00039D9CCC|nr:NAD-dependent dehydratase [Sphingobium bisphenolivorans]